MSYQFLEVTSFGRHDVNDTEPMHTVYTGVESGFTVRFADATTFALDRMFRFTNRTSHRIKIQNIDDSYNQYLLPNHTAQWEVTDRTTAAGVWTFSDYQNEEKFIETANDTTYDVTELDYPRLIFYGSATNFKVKFADATTFAALTSYQITNHNSYPITILNSTESIYFTLEIKCTTQWDLIANTTIAGDWRIAQNPYYIAASVINRNWYVNTVTGNDANDGLSNLRPFKTFDKALSLIPNYIDCIINIFVSAPAASPVTHVNPVVLSFSDAGQLTIQGTDDPVVRKGPYTVNTIVRQGVAQVFGYEITPTVAPGWTIDAEVGYFIRMLTGTRAGSVYAILENTTGALYIANTYYPFSPGDTFDIVSPGTTIDLGTDVFYLNIKGQMNAWFQNSQFILANINQPGYGLMHYHLEDIKIMNAFVRTYYTSITGFSSHINHYPAKYPTQLVNSSLRLDDYPYFYSAATELNAFGITLFRLTTDTIYGYHCGFNLLLDCGLKTLDDWHSDGYYIDRTFFRSCTGDSIKTHGSKCRLEFSDYGVWVKGCVNFVNLVKGEVSAYFIEGVANGITGHTFLIGGCSNLTFTGTLLSGVTGAIKWKSSGLTASFPTVGSPVTDGAGSFAVKLPV